MQFLLLTMHETSHHLPTTCCMGGYHYQPVMLNTCTCMQAHTCITCIYYLHFIQYTGEDDSRIFTLPSCCGPVTYVELSHYSFWSFSSFFTNCSTEVVSQKDRGNQLQFACACPSYFTLQTETSGHMLLSTSLSEAITPCWFLAVYQLRNIIYQDYCCVKHNYIS